MSEYRSKWFEHSVEAVFLFNRGTKANETVTDKLMSQLEELTSSLAKTIHHLDYKALTEKKKGKAMLYLYIPR